MQKSRFFPEIEMDRVKRLRDVSAHIGHAFLASIKRSEKREGIEQEGIIAATYFRRAAANSVLLDDFSLASELFGEAARCYQHARMPYGIVMEALSGRQTNDWSWQATGESPQDVYTLMAELGKKMRPYDSLQKARHQLDEFRGERLGVFAHSLDQYLDLFDAVYMSTKNGKERIHTLREALLPFVQTYSSALQRAKRDKFHWQRLAMIFHPVEPDVIGLLVLTNNAIMGSGLKEYNLLEGLPVSREATEVLSYFLHNIGRGPNNHMEGDEE
jgi:hypothetical protein